jgi:hypothetical protein
MIIMVVAGRMIRNGKGVQSRQLEQIRESIEQGVTLRGEVE